MSIKIYKITLVIVLILINNCDYFAEDKWDKDCLDFGYQFTFDKKTCVSTLLFELSKVPDFQYPHQSMAFVLNEEYIFKPVIKQGDLIEFSINNSLPSGLNIGKYDGSISGKPTQVTDEFEYEITAKNLGGSSLQKLKLKIVSNKEVVTCKDMYSISCGDYYTPFSCENAGNKCFKSVEVCQRSDYCNY